MRVDKRFIASMLTSMLTIADGFFLRHYSLYLLGIDRRYERDKAEKDESVGESSNGERASWEAKRVHTFAQRHKISRDRMN